MNSAATVDVVVLGGGIAGLTLARQLQKRDPAAEVVVLERAEHPVPETTHKVGESTVEIAGHYLREELGLGDLLGRRQLNKFGLRVFFSHGDNADITSRLELGHSAPPSAAVGTYQLDRGRLENDLHDLLSQEGVRLVGGTSIRTVELSTTGGPHTVAYLQDGARHELQARWVVDATGRAALLRRQMDLTREVGHTANAVWFRLAESIDIDEWSDDQLWRGRISQGRRELSTNHLMGAGYWVWMIRLATGGISIGIVADPGFHPFSEMRTFAKALEWLKGHEPQLAAAVEAKRDSLLDFKVMTNYSYGAAEVYSGARWCLTGEAGLFLDPLYSPGLDLIAISNTFVSDLVVRDLHGEDVSERAAVHNQVYLMIADGWMSIYENQFGTMGSPNAMAAKVIWDTAVYWAVVGLLYFQDALVDVVDHPDVLLALARVSELSRRVQAFFREWATIDDQTGTAGFVRFYDFDFMGDLHAGMAVVAEGRTLEQQLEANVSLVERVTGQMVSDAIEASACSSHAEAARQVAEWRRDPVLVAAVRAHDAHVQHLPQGGARFAGIPASHGAPA